MSLIIDEKELADRVSETELTYTRIGKGNTSNHENSGRNKGDSNLVPFVRNIIAAEAIEGVGTAKEIAEAWGVSESTVNNYKNGKHTNGELKSAHPEILDVANRIIKRTKARKVKIADKTTKLLLEAMESLDMEKVKKEKPVVQTAIMRNLATIADKMEDHEDENDANANGNVHFHVHVPAPLKLDMLPAVTIEEKPFKR